MQWGCWGMTGEFNRQLPSNLEQFGLWFGNNVIQPGNSRPEQTKAYIDAVTTDFGYAKPFTDEQKLLNTLLVENGADLLTCFAAWSRYHDLKTHEDLSAIRNQYSFEIAAE